MSRGAQSSTRKLTDQQLAIQNQLISQANAQGAQDRSLLVPGIEQFLTSQGYTPAEQSAITQQSMGAAQTAFDALRERAANRVARTNNPAGYDALTAELGRQQAQDLASVAQQDQIAFANERVREQLAGLNAAAETYGIDTNLLGRAMGVPAELLGVRERASQGPGLGAFLGGVGFGLGSLFG